MDLTAPTAAPRSGTGCDPGSVAHIMAALASSRRLEIVRLISTADLDVGEIAHRDAPTWAGDAVDYDAWFDTPTGGPACTARSTRRALSPASHGSAL